MPDVDHAYAGNQLPDPRLTFVYRVEATLAEPLDLGDTAGGRRRIAVQTGGTFAGPGLNGTLLPGASADWQLVLADGTALGDIRYTLQTDDGELLYVRSRGIRHGPAEVLARLARGDDVDASEYTFRTSTQIETAAPRLDWMNKGIFVSVGGRRPGSRRLRDLPRRMSPDARVATGRDRHRRIGRYRRGNGSGVPRGRLRRRRHPRSMPASDDPDLLTVEGDLAQAQTAPRVVDQTLERFGRIVPNAKYLPVPGDHRGALMSAEFRAAALDFLH